MHCHAKVSQFAHTAIEKEKVLSCRQRGKKRVTYALCACVHIMHVYCTFDVSVQDSPLVEVVDCRQELLQEVCNK